MLGRYQPHQQSDEVAIGCSILRDSVERLWLASSVRIHQHALYGVGQH